MNMLERLVARWLLNRIVKQGRAWESVGGLFVMLRQEWKTEFYEDNDPTKFGRLDEIYAKSEYRT